jgi:hypothetical protein
MATGVAGGSGGGFWAELLAGVPAGCPGGWAFAETDCAAIADAGTEVTAAAGATAEACTITVDAVAFGESACSAAPCAVAPVPLASESLLVFEFVFALICDTRGAGVTGELALLCNPAAVEFVAGAAVPKVEPARLAALTAGRIIFGKVEAADSVPGPGLEK